MSKAKVAIVTDSTVNLPVDVIKEHNIYVIPQILNWEGKSYLDQIDISAMLSSILRRLAELKAGTGGMSAAQAEAERWQLGNLLDQIAVYIPRTEWSRHESLQPSAETAKPWRRPPG